ncbi:MAG TPA: transcriptional regulator [Opitutae bacterium]|nr:transcriptional regulator [Opitutae bacterium]
MKAEEFKKLKEDFIAQWGTLGSCWGINRTMAQIHAFLMMAVEPTDTNTVMDALKISRGNANSNLRDLVGWGLIKRVTYPGDRKEYFEAEKDVWAMFCIIARERKRREIDPALNLLQSSSSNSFNQNNEEQQLFLKQTAALAEFVQTASSALDKIARAEQSKVLPFIVKRL